MSVCTDAGYADGPVDITNGLPYYCLDADGNPQYLSSNSGGVNATPVTSSSATPAPLQTAGSPSSLIGDFSAIEADILAGFRAVTAPPPPAPGTAALSITGGAAGTNISVSPIILVVIGLVAYFALRRG